MSKTLTEINIGLFRCGIAILNDACPFDSASYLCKQAEWCDEDICNRCWSDYLFKVANGEADTIQTEGE